MILGCFLLQGVDALQILREKVNFKLYQGRISVQKKEKKRRCNKPLTCILQIKKTK